MTIEKLKAWAIELRVGGAYPAVPVYHPSADTRWKTGLYLARRNARNATRRRVDGRPVRIMITLSREDGEPALWPPPLDLEDDILVWNIASEVWECAVRSEKPGAWLDAGNNRILSCSVSHFRPMLPPPGAGT